MTSPTSKPSLDVGNDVTTPDVVIGDDFGSRASDQSPGLTLGIAAKERSLVQRPSPFSSPETRRKRTSWRKTVFMKELEAIGHEIRRAGDSLRGSMESLIGNCSTSNRIQTEGGPAGEEKRRIRIETASDIRSAAGNGRRKGGTPAEVDVGDWIDDVSNDRNFSSALIVTKLENGLFSAQVAMETIPFGNIVIRIRNYRLEIVLDRRGGGGGGGGGGVGVPPPQMVGSIDVPIYVDTSTLHFRLDAERDVLHLEGVMKGCLDREHSVSAVDLRSLMTSHNFRKKLKAKMNARGGTNGGDVSGSSDDSENVKQQQHGVGSADSWVDRFRSRAYTH